MARDFASRWRLDPPRTPLQQTLDLAALIVLFLLGLVGFHQVYGNPFYLISGAVALVLGLLIALLGAQYRWGFLRMAGAVLGVHLLLGSAMATPDHAYAGFIPTLTSLWDLIRATWETWMANLTVVAPVGTGDGVLAVVWISLLLLGTLAFTIVQRTRLYLLAWAMPVVFLLLSVVFTTAAPTMPLVRGIAFALVSVVWMTWRHESARLATATSTIMSDTVRPGSWKNPVLRRRVVGGGVILALTAMIALLAHPLLDPPEGQARFAVRETVRPPFDPRRYVSPLTEIRGYHKNQKESPLFSVEGAEAGELVRIATMDQYDLQVYNVAGSPEEDSDTGSFLKATGGVDLSEAAPNARTVHISIEEYRGVWVPFPGQTLHRIEPTGEDTSRMQENLYFNEPAQTLVDASGLRAGDSYDVTYEPYTAPTEEQRRTMRFADVELPENAELDGKVGDVAEELIGSPDTDAEAMENLISGVKAEGYFSHGIDDQAASLSGHGSARLLMMLEPVGFEDEPDAAPTGMIGDEEQYAALIAVMARSQGIPARVVMGFTVPEGGDGQVTGEDVTAWVEVAYAGVGWVRYDVVPDEDDTPTQPEPEEVEQPRPQVAQPPPPPVEPPTPPPGAISEDNPEEEDLPEPLPAFLRWILIALSPVLLIALLIAAIIGAKALRRRRRRGSEDAAARLHGGWDEILDLRHDMAQKVPLSLTRREAARMIAADVQDAPVLDLARTADRGVFGPGDMSPAELDAYWDTVMDSRAAMLAPMTGWQRFRAAVSLRSFGRSTRGERTEARRRRRADAAAARRERGAVTPRWRSALDRVREEFPKRRESWPRREEKE